jgi:Flp pilus assembly protein CpaB
MVLAALAGLLAIAGAFLLVWYLNNGNNDEVADGDAPAGQVTEATEQEERQVLVVVETIPRNTSVAELIEAPTVYLTARAVPEEFVAASAITSVAELRELDGLVLSSDALPGEQLLRGRFRDPNDFDSVTETFLEAETNIEIPAGHHAVVLELPSSRALGGNIQPGEKVTVVGGFRVVPGENDLNIDPFELSVVVLNSVEIVSVQSTLEVAGQLSSDLNTAGTANRGSFSIALAVTPEELTDLTYAQNYGSITLATAVEGLENDGPKAATIINQIIGDDGVWLAQLEDGNLIDLTGLLVSDENGESITLELPEEDEEEPDALQQVDNGGDSDNDADPLIDEEDPGDS